jgi:hypothetical protein
MPSQTPLKPGVMSVDPSAFILTQPQLEALLSEPTAASAVQALPSPTLHRWACSLDHTAARELLALATPDQLREVLDLEIWQGDRLKIEEGTHWLHLLTQLPDKAFHRDLAALDPELLGFLILQSLRIHLNEDEDNDFRDELEGYLYPTPDGWFTLEFFEEDQEPISRWIDIIEALYRDDPDHTRRLLQSLIGELPSELEEVSYRWRQGRLADLGFADPEEALKIYAYLDPATVLPTEKTRDVPLRAELEPIGHGDLMTILPSTASFWQRAIAHLGDPAERDRQAQAILMLSNRCLTADRISPADPLGVQQSLEQLSWRLSLGLEHLCQGAIERAEPILRQVALLRLARLGHSLALDLRQRILAPLRQGVFGHTPGKTDLLDEPLNRQLSALARPRPRFYDATLDRERAFQTLEDLQTAHRWIDQALAMVQLARNLTFNPPLPEGTTCGNLYRTYLVNAALGREGPLDHAALTRFLSEGHLLRPLADPSPAVLTGVAQPLGAELLAHWAEELIQELRAIAPADLDLRFISGLWLTHQ